MDLTRQELNRLQMGTDIVLEFTFLMTQLPFRTQRLHPTSFTRSIHVCCTQGFFPRPLGALYATQSVALHYFFTAVQPLPRISVIRFISEADLCSLLFRAIRNPGKLQFHPVLSLLFILFVGAFRRSLHRKSPAWIPAY